MEAEITPLLRYSHSVIHIRTLIILELLVRIDVNVDSPTPKDENISNHGYIST